MNTTQLPFDEEVYGWIPKSVPTFYQISALPFDFNVRIMVITLICSLMAAYQKAGKDLTFEELIDKLLDQGSPSIRAELASMCSALYTYGSTYDKYGLKSAKDIKEKLNIVFKEELPF